MLGKIFESVSQSRAGKIIVASREKILSYIEEASLISGVGVGAAFAGDTILRKLPLPYNEGMVLTEAFMKGSLSVIIVGFVPPLLANIADTILRKDDDTTDNLFPYHNHKPARLAGLVTGAAASFALAVNMVGVPGQGPEISSSYLRTGLVKMAEQVEVVGKKIGNDLVLAGLH